MATYTMQPAQPLAADGATLTRVLQRAGATKDSVVRVTGPAGMTAVLWLSQHGYQRAAYIHAARVASMDPADALLIPQNCAARELADLLQGGGCLRDGGVLIVQTPSARLMLECDTVPAVLQPLGYQVEQRLSDKGRDVYIARRHAHGGFRKAA